MDAWLESRAEEMGEDYAVIALMRGNIDESRWGRIASVFSSDDIS